MSLAPPVQGFTRSETHPNAPQRNDMVPLVVNLHQDRPKSVLVSPVDDGGVAPVWLAKKLIKLSPAKALGAHGVTLRIELPRWLAEEKHLIAVAGEGQGVLL